MVGETSGAPYLPFEGGAFRLTMGLMPLAEADWLEIGDDLVARLAEKRALLAAHHAAVFAALPEARAAAVELLALLCAHVLRHHPTLYRRCGESLGNAATGETWEIAGTALHPLDLAGRLVPEDLCLLQSDGGLYRLTAASLCAPTRWRLADKLGRPLAAIHAPVPGYDARLATPVDRFFAHVKPGKPVWRLNWGLSDDPARFQPEAGPAAPAVSSATAGERLWLRVERQTLRRLAQSGAVVFTIRTHITRLDAAIVEPAAAATLAAAIRAMPEAMQRYKRIADVAGAALAWLDARAAAPV